MWSKVVLSAVLFGIISMIYAQTTTNTDDTSDSPRKLKVRCRRGDIYNGSPVTVKSFCKSNYSVEAPGILEIDTSKYPLKLAVSIQDEDKNDVTNKLEKQIDNVEALPNKENITDLIPVVDLQTLTASCPVQGALDLTIADSNGQELFYAKLRSRIWCNNAEVDLQFIASGDQSMIYLSDTGKTLKGAMTGMDYEVNANSVGESFQAYPQQGDVDTGIFAVAFLTKYKDGMSLDENACLENGNRMPELDDKSIIVGLEVFKSNDEVANSFGLLSDVKANDKELHICGDYVLVFLIDALNTLGNEQNRCNNFVTRRINSTRACDSLPPRCELIRNAWSNGEARILFERTQGMESSGRKFDFDEEKLEERDEKDMREKNFTRRAYGRLNVLSHYIDSKIQENPQLCATEPVNMVKAMEEDTESTEDISEGVTLPAVVMKAVNFVQQSAPTTGEEDALQLELNALKETTGDSFHAKMVTKIGIHALETALSLKDQADPDADSAFCDLPWRLEELQWYDEHSMDEEKLFELAGDVASAYVSKQGPCLERILKRFLMFSEIADQGEEIETSAIVVDQEFLNTEDDVRRCGKPIKCLKKLRRVCNGKDIANSWQDVDDESKAEICKMYVMKEFAKKHFMVLGMKDLFEKVVEYDEMHGEQCNRDPLRPDSPESQAFWTEKVENGRKFIYQGMMNDDYSKVAWRKKAVCTCTECMYGGDKQGMDDGMMGTDDGKSETDGEKMGDTGDEIKRRRRRRR